MGGNLPADASDAHLADAKSIDEILASITGGRESQPEIFETLKSVAQAPHSTDDLLTEERKPRKPERPAEPPVEQFVCPVCNSAVDGEAESCPGCGAQFVEGEEAEFECPVCKSAVASDADRCPSCGVRFATEEEPAAFEESPEPSVDIGIGEPQGPPAVGEPSMAPGLAGMKITLRDRLAAVREAKREAPSELPLGDRKLMYRELPKLVNDVKALLLTAKKIGLQIEGEKRLINDAIASGKRRDIERAVGLIDKARRSLDVAFTDYVAARIDAFAVEIQRTGGANAQEIERTLQDSVNHLESGNYESAWDLYQAAAEGFQAKAKEFHKARDTLDQDERLLAEARALGMNTKEIDRLARQGREAMQRKDQKAALRLAQQARERIAREIPEFIQREMKVARNTLLDLKVQGGDLSKPIGVLKAASVHVKKEEWTDALRYLRQFRKEVDGL